MSDTENNSMHVELVWEKDLKTNGFDVVTSDEIEIKIIPENVDISENKK